MFRVRPATLILVVLIAIHTSFAMAAETAKGTFRYGKVRFEPVDALAFQEPRKEGPPQSMVIFTNFKIDRQAVIDAINTPGAIFMQAAHVDTGAYVIVTMVSADRCGVSGFLNQTQQQIELGKDFPAKVSSMTATHSAGECFTSKPGKIFDDSYEFHLTYDQPVTVIPRPKPLPAGGADPGASYAALVKAIQTRDWNVAKARLPEEQIPATPPKTTELKDYFHGLALNYPKTVSVIGGLIKGDRANLDIRGTDNDSKKITGVVAMRKTGEQWRVVDQSLYFDDSGTP